MSIIIYQPESIVVIEDDVPDESLATVDQSGNEMGIMAGRTPTGPGVPRTIRLGSYTLVFDGRTWRRVHN